MPLSKWPGWDPLPEAQPSKNYFFVISTPCCIILDGSRSFLFLTPPNNYANAIKTEEIASIFNFKAFLLISCVI